MSLWVWLWAACVDLKKQFWEFLRLRGILTRIIGVIDSLYIDTLSTVNYEASLSSFFRSEAGMCSSNNTFQYLNELGNIMVYVLADNVAILSESLKTLMVALAILWK